jgi:hypothetical protein
VSGGLDAAGTAPDPEGRQKLVDGPGAGRTPDFGFSAEPDQSLELRGASLAAELVERHKGAIVKENRPARKEDPPPCAEPGLGLP